MQRQTRTLNFSYSTYLIKYLGMDLVCSVDIREKAALVKAESNWDLWKDQRIWKSLEAFKGQWPLTCFCPLSFIELITVQPQKRKAIFLFTYIHKKGSAYLNFQEDRKRNPRLFVGCSHKTRFSQFSESMPTTSLYMRIADISQWET